MFALIAGRLVTPSTSSGILHGITRERIIELAATVGLPVEQRDVTSYELLHADEIFLTRHARGGRRGGLRIGGGKTCPRTRRLQDAFRQITTNPAYGTPVHQEVDR